MKQTTNLNNYESPQMEVMEVVTEGIFCTSMEPSDFDMGN